VAAEAARRWGLILAETVEQPRALPVRPEADDPQFQRRPVIKPADVSLEVMDVKVTPDIDAGYIVGAGDPGGLRQPPDRQIVGICPRMRTTC
jgi:hypothetical protein